MYIMCAVFMRVINTNKLDVEFGKVPYFLFEKLKCGRRERKKI